MKAEQVFGVIKVEWMERKKRLKESKREQNAAEEVSILAQVGSVLHINCSCVLSVLKTVVALNK